MCSMCCVMSDSTSAGETPMLQLADASAAVEAGGGALSSVPRTGLDGWQVVDLDPACFAGASLQLTQEPDR